MVIVIIIRKITNIFETRRQLPNKNQIRNYRPRLRRNTLFFNRNAVGESFFICSKPTIKLHYLNLYPSFILNMKSIIELLTKLQRKKRL